MPLMGLGLHVLVALFFAVHAVRTGREMYWLMILFAFPLLGSIVYFFAVYLPGSRLHYDVRKATVAAVKTLDPGKELRDAEQAFEFTPTAQNQMRLAQALLEAGSTAEAVRHFNACLKGPFASDPEIRLSAARAHLLNGEGAAAIELLDAIRKQNADYRAEQVSLLLAQAYAREGRNNDARTEYISAVARFGSFEARAEYAIWALSVGDMLAASEQYSKIERAMKHWNRHTRSLNSSMVKRLELAFAAAHRA